MSRTAGGASLQRWLAGTALVLAVLAPVAGSPYGSSEERLAGRISAIELAEWLRDGRHVQVVDLRDATAFEAFHLPRATRGTGASVASQALTAADTLVLYGEPNGSVLRAWMSLRHRAPAVRYMVDGVGDWVADVLNPTLDVPATPAERAAFEQVAELSRYFGGQPRTGVVPGDSVGTEELLRRAARRGCAF